MPLPCQDAPLARTQKSIVPPLRSISFKSLMKDRVKQVMDYYKLSQLQFANDLAVAPATISNIYKGKTAPTNNLVQSIHQAFPDVSINWLLFGEGDMLLSQSSEPKNAATATAIAPASEPTLFDATAIPPMPASPRRGEQPDSPTNLQILELLTELKHNSTVEPRVRKIKEIRVFYDHGTYESFGSNK